jgi:hypothetical protein
MWTRLTHRRCSRRTPHLTAVCYSSCPCIAMGWMARTNREVSCSNPGHGTGFSFSVIFFSPYELQLTPLDSHHFDLTWLMTIPWSRVSVVDIATELRTGQSGGRTPVGARDFISSPECPDRFVGPSGFPFSGNGLKRPGCDINHTPPFRADAENQWTVPLLPPYSFMAWKGTTSSLTF